jgi:TRAP-type C4-dicarboxylate transport system permease small subunit
VISGITGFVAWQSWTVLKKLALVGQSSMATEIPMVIPHAAIFVSFALISLVSLVQAFRPPPDATMQSKASSAEEGRP